MRDEKTLILIKPDGIKRRLTGLALDRLEAEGLEMAAAKVVSVSEKLAREHYQEHAGKPFYEMLVKFIRGEYHGVNKVCTFVYKGEDAVARARRVVGATNPEEALAGTIRGSFGRLKDGRMENVVHASANHADAEREISLWFNPGEIIE